VSRDIDNLLAALRGGDRRSAARLISRIEAGDGELAPLLARLQAEPRHTPVIGITGPPGAGKSTLLDQLLRLYRARGQRVALLAVDPSSPFTGGALLGDRARLQRHNGDAGVFIRSMATRGQLGGLAAAAGAALAVLDALGWDRLLLESVGVGQNEVEIARHAGTVVLLLTPHSGDQLQAAKAGVLEIADLLVVNKADAPGAQRMLAALREQLGDIPILATRADRGEGVEALLEAIEAHLPGPGSRPKLAGREGGHG
jgi:LAO/AO transport system kinase